MSRAEVGRALGRLRLERRRHRSFGSHVDADQEQVSFLRCIVTFIIQATARNPIYFTFKIISQKNHVSFTKLIFFKIPTTTSRSLSHKKVSEYINCTFEIWQINVTAVQKLFISSLCCLTRDNQLWLESKMLAYYESLGYEGIGEWK